MGFIQDKRRGKVGERVVKGYFEAIGADIRDLSEESEYQAQDVDLIAADGLTYEVKTDYSFSETATARTLTRGRGVRLGSRRGCRRGWCRRTIG